MCGGTWRISTTSLASLGLSPRVRGNRASWWLQLVPPRSIPACAGEPFADSKAERKKEVYPRVCGGTAVKPIVFDGARGLSPRVRGNPRRRGARE